MGGPEGESERVVERGRLGLYPRLAAGGWEGAVYDNLS